MKISVCMATYNGELFIREQLSSILPLLSDQDELIISDDGSTDMTLEIIKSYEDPRIILLDNKVFNSPIFNFENAMSKVSGDVIVLSDQDDIWKANKLIKIREKFQGLDNNVELKMFNGNCIDAEGSIIRDDLFFYLSVKDGLYSNIVKNSFMGCNMSFSKKLLDYALPFPRRIPMHDVWLASCAYVFGNVEFVNEKVFSYRLHDGNYTGAISSILKKIEWRFFFYF